MHGVVLQVEEQSALADAEIFGRAFNDRLLEVALKIQYLHSTVITRTIKQARATNNKFNLNPARVVTRSSVFAAVLT
jgi:hypothetical protein